MCDIWKDNQNLRQLSEQDIAAFLPTLRKHGTRQVLMSGGEALLNPLFFSFCALLNKEGINVSLLSTGLTLARHAEKIVEHVHDVIVSVDGDAERHNSIRGIPNAFEKMASGVHTIKVIQPDFPVSSRTVIHRQNFRHWISIIEAGLDMGLDRMSFLPADVSSHAFNREILWTNAKKSEIMPAREELPELKAVLNEVTGYIEKNHLESFVAEPPEKRANIYRHYAALWGEQPFPFKKCNAPWVSVVVEADGKVRPCFFHEPFGNIHDEDLADIINGKAALAFRNSLDMRKNETCARCVCSLYLPTQNDSPL
jgi:MoaA/NifB/PqqE/SkfB family radical SAM enzyme